MLRPRYVLVRPIEELDYRLIIGSTKNRSHVGQLSSLGPSYSEPGQQHETKSQSGIGLEASKGPQVR